MQAIAKSKSSLQKTRRRLIVDYLTLQQDLKMLWHFTLMQVEGNPTILQEQAVQLMLEKLEVVFSNVSWHFEYETYFEADTSKKLSMILAAEELYFRIRKMERNATSTRSNSIVKSLLPLLFRMKQWMQRRSFIFKASKSKVGKI